MDMTKLTFRISGLALALAGSIAGTAFAQDHSLGALYPMSGSNAEYGQIFSSGSELAVRHVNEDAMLPGGLTLQIEDSQALPAQGVTGMNKLVSVDQIPYVMTSFTGVSKAIAPIGAETGTVMINGGGVGPDLAELGPYFWNIIPLANDEMRALVPYVVNELGLQRAVLIYVDDPLGQSVLEVLEDLVPQNGGELVGEHSIPVTAQQFSGIAATVRTQRPDVIFIASYGAQQAALVKQLRDNGLDQQLASYTSFSTPTMQELPEAAGALFTQQYIDREKGDALTQRFFDDYIAEYDRDPSIYVVNYYNAVMLYANLAQYVDEQGQELTGENLLAARQAIGSFEFVGSTVTFNENGTVQAPIEIRRLTGNSGSEAVTIVE